MLSRIVSAILLVLVGAVFGAIGTIAHQISVTWGIGIPLGVIGALAAFAALLAALGAIVVILLFSQQSAGGSVLIPNNLAGQVWLVGCILVAAVVIAWPDVRGRRPARDGIS